MALVDTIDDRNMIAIVEDIRACDEGVCVSIDDSTKLKFPMTPDDRKKRESYFRYYTNKTNAKPMVFIRHNGPYIISMSLMSCDYISLVRKESDKIFVSSGYAPGVLSIQVNTLQAQQFDNLGDIFSSKDFMGAPKSYKKLAISYDPGSGEVYYIADNPKVCRE